MPFHLFRYFLQSPMFPLGDKYLSILMSPSAFPCALCHSKSQESFGQGCMPSKSQGNLESSSNTALCDAGLLGGGPKTAWKSKEVGGDFQNRVIPERRPHFFTPSVVWVGHSVSQSLVCTIKRSNWTDLKSSMVSLERGLDGTDF